MLADILLDISNSVEELSIERVIWQDSKVNQTKISSYIHRWQSLRCQYTRLTVLKLSSYWASQQSLSYQATTVTQYSSVNWPLNDLLCVLRLGRSSFVGFQEGRGSVPTLAWNWSLSPRCCFLMSQPVDWMHTLPSQSSNYWNSMYQAYTCYCIRK